MTSSGDTATQLLRRKGDGDDEAGEELLPRVYAELRRLAESYLLRERRQHTLQATALVNEAYLRMIGSSGLAKGDREHFLAIGALAMRRVLVDHARKRNRDRRGGGVWERVTLGAVPPGLPEEFDLIELNDLLERLARVDERGARVVELRFFAGLSIAEIAEVLGVSRGTVDNDWYAARAWLRRALRRGESHG